MTGHVLVRRLAASNRQHRAPVGVAHALYLPLHGLSRVKSTIAATFLQHFQDLTPMWAKSAVFRQQIFGAISVGSYKSFGAMELGDAFYWLPPRIYKKPLTTASWGNLIPRRKETQTYGAFGRLPEVLTTISTTGI